MKTKHSHLYLQRWILFPPTVHLPLEAFKKDQPNALKSDRRKAPPHSAVGVLGVAAIAGAFTEKILKDMAAFNERPIVFALSNPTSKAECTAEQCYRLTEVLELSAGKPGALGTPWPWLYQGNHSGAWWADK